MQLLKQKSQTTHGFQNTEKKTHEIVHKHGGRNLSRSGNIEVLEGDPPPTTLIALLEFPNAEAVKSFATDPDYAPLGSARQAGSNSRFRLIDDTDIAGTISYLGKDKPRIKLDFGWR